MRLKGFMKIQVNLKIIDNLLKESVEYRTHYIASILVITLPLIFIFLLWDSIFTEVNFIGDYTNIKIVTYYILVILLRDVFYAGVNYEIANDIREGRLSNYLVKPYSYFGHSLSIKIGANIQYIPMTVVILAIFDQLFLKKFFFPSVFSNYLYFFIVLFLSFILSFLLTFTISLTAFWIEEISSLQTFLDIIVPISAGALLPLSLFPEFLQKFFSFLPFKYLLNFPIETYLGNLMPSEIFVGIFVEAVWIIVFCFSAYFLWRAGTKKYQAYGG
ncbi:MAG TPA: hypothetical protein ENI34_05080 [candidate division WOR-3 bacterium]|uniref:ABC transporter permease n=1 Tax=candidate division WOR-3 bacterium TaxID=2052148 RepID=A0A9C9ENB9_UNCW3|nr:hypothetical protein [candidate division WOR-3 bacterium]